MKRFEHAPAAINFLLGDGRMTIQQIADEVPCDRSTIWRIRENLTEPTRLTKRRLCEIASKKYRSTKRRKKSNGN